MITQKCNNAQTPENKGFESHEPHNLDLPLRHCETSYPAGSRFTQQLVLSGGTQHWIDLPGDFTRTEEENSLCGSSATSQERQDFQIEVSAMISEWPSTKLKGIAGVINQLVWHWADCFGATRKAIQKTEYGPKEMVFGCDRKKVQLALQTHALLNTSITSTVNYIKRFWSGSGASCSRATVKRYTAELKDMGLLDYQSEFQSTGRARSRFYTHLDIPRLLLLAEVIIDRLQQMQAPMPSHWGQFMGWLYDAVFSGWGWRRKGHPEEVEPETHEESMQVRANASYEARAEMIKDNLRSISFRSALQHLAALGDLWRIGRSKDLLRRLQIARGWAVERCRNDYDHEAIAGVMPQILDNT